MRRRAGPELTPWTATRDECMERREEAWRPLNKHRVAAFIRMLSSVRVETREWSPPWATPRDCEDHYTRPWLTRIIPLFVEG